MNVELAQMIALIAYGNEYLSSESRESRELFPSHSTFHYISDVSFQWGTALNPSPKRSEALARNTNTGGWFSRLGTDGVRYLKLDLLNLQDLPSPYATSIFTAGGAWVIQTDKGKCWKANWSFISPVSRQVKLWKVEYWECDNIPVIRDFPDIETTYQDLEASLVEARNFSERRRFGWEKWFGKAIELLHDSSPVLPFYADLLPPTLRNIKVRQLLAGALQAWVFGGLGSWNDMYITDRSVEQEYQQISKNLYEAVINSLGAVTNSTVDDRLSQLSIP
jgi:hypothetical protein